MTRSRLGLSWLYSKLTGVRCIQICQVMAGFRFCWSWLDSDLASHGWIQFLLDMAGFRFDWSWLDSDLAGHGWIWFGSSWLDSLLLVMAGLNCGWIQIWFIISDWAGSWLDSDWAGHGWIHIGLVLARSRSAIHPLVQHSSFLTRSWPWLY